MAATRLSALLSTTSRTRTPSPARSSRPIARTSPSHRPQSTRHESIDHWSTRLGQFKLHQYRQPPPPATVPIPLIHRKSPLPPSPVVSPASIVPDPASCMLLRSASCGPSFAIQLATASTNAKPATGSALAVETESASPLLRIPPEILVEVILKYPPNLSKLRRTCMLLYKRLDASFLSSLVPIAQAGLLDAGRFAVANGCGDVRVLDRLLQAGTNPRSLLEWCCLLNRTALVRYLVKDRSEPLATTPKALFWAASRGHGKTVRLLLDCGALADEDALRAATRNHHKTVVRLLLTRGAEPTSSALEAALRGGHMDLFRMLLDRGAPPNDDVLSQAAYEGREDIVRLLLAKGAVVSERAIDYAGWGERENIVALLEAAA